MAETAPLTQDQALDAAKNLSRREFRRYIEAREVDAALARGEQPPSALGRWFKPAETERKLVLFTLGIIVLALVIGVFVIEMWSDSADPSSVTTPLVTLAGTGLGFIGGMVSDRRRSDRSEQPPGGEATEPTAAAITTDGDTAGDSG